MLILLQPHIIHLLNKYYNISRFQTYSEFGFLLRKITSNKSFRHVSIQLLYSFLRQNIRVVKTKLVILISLQAQIHFTTGSDTILQVKIRQGDRGFEYDNYTLDRACYVTKLHIFFYTTFFRNALQVNMEAIFISTTFQGG